MDENKSSSKTALGLDENVEALLTYVLGWVTGVVFLVLEKENKFVRFHAIQSIGTFLAVSVLYWIFFIFPFGLWWLLYYILGPLIFVLWLVLMYKAYNHEYFKLPVIGDIAAKQANK